MSIAQHNVGNANKRSGLNGARATCHGPKRGQSLVEFAIGLLVLLLLVFGVVDLGRAVFAYNSISHCAREGTRYAVVHGAESPTPIGPADNDPALDNLLRAKYAVGLDTSRLTINSNWAGGNNAPGATVTVTVRYSFQSAILFALPLSLQSRSSGTIVN
ncbi:MAG: pilus assembly protein [Verrucomicrobia bacterium]|nr:pilus assembly protein [Verrucomicrobiota bacterium]